MFRKIGQLLCRVSLHLGDPIVSSRTDWRLLFCRNTKQAVSPQCIAAGGTCCQSVPLLVMLTFILKIDAIKCLHLYRHLFPQQTVTQWFEHFLLVFAFSYYSKVFAKLIGIFKGPMCVKYRDRTVGGWDGSREVSEEAATVVWSGANASSA